MPPRRSVARNAATPARSTRGTSAVALDASATRRSARGASKQLGVNDDVVNNPQLPELQTQQSYAYGSTKNPLLPEQLVAREKMTLSQMAESIDAGVRQADMHFESHNVEAKGILERSPRAERATSRGSREPSREASVNPDKLLKQKKDMVAAWADSLESSQLDDIDEEGSPDLDIRDDDTRRDTELSSFPSGIFDHSYNYERGVRQLHPRVTLLSRINDSTQVIWNRLRSTLRNSLGKLEDAASQISHGTLSGIHAIFSGLRGRSLFSDLGKIVASIFMGLAVSVLFCSLYTRTLCDPTSFSQVSVALQSLCGQCALSPNTPINLTPGDLNDSRKLNSFLKQIHGKIAQVEQRLSQTLDQKYEKFQSEITSLKKQQTEVSNHLASLHQTPKSTVADRVSSPLIPQINFFAPSNGALINPRLTSPTKQKPYPWYRRIPMSMLGLSRHQSHPPITALESWQDVGDCWCSSDSSPPNSDLARLAVTVAQPVFPQELVIEHIHAAGTLSPDTAPRQIELWADFDHLDAADWQQLGVRQMQKEGDEDAPLGPSYALVGKMEYDHSGRGEHVQAKSLDVNQQENGMLYYARHFVVRIKTSYGAGHVCLYRVRLHGTPVSGQKDGEAG